MCIALEHLFDYDDFRKFLQDYFEPILRGEGGI